MKVRLIGIGAVGEEILLACVNEFRNLGIARMLESVRIVHMTSRVMCDTLEAVVADVQHLLKSPKEELWLRGGLGYLFFGTPTADFEVRRKILLKEATPTALPDLPDIKFWREELIARLGTESERLTRVRAHLQRGCIDHGSYVQKIQACLQQAGLGPGGDRDQENARVRQWLLVPRMPVERAGLKPRRAHIGRKLMRAVLRAGGQQLLVNNLGKTPPDGPDLDIVVIAFSAGDSFGCDGAEFLAEQIRDALKHPEATRILATLGFAVYEQDNDQVQDGRCSARYLGLSRLRGQLDGLMVRPSQSAHGQQPGYGFPKLLASLTMASDPDVIQIDNPDANQIQRDFGRRLFAAGYVDAGAVPPVQPTAGNRNAPMNLAQMYQAALRDLDAWHHRSERLSHFRGVLHEAVTKLNERLKVPAPVPTPGQDPAPGEPPAVLDTPPGAHASPSGGPPAPAWEPPGWFRVLTEQAPPGAVSRIEHLTARKVIAYVGHNGKLNAQEVQDLRRLICRDFPRARTVVYKYKIVPGQPGAAAPVANPTAAPAANPGAAPVPVAVPVAIPPAAPPDGAPIAHFALFIIDAFQTLAFERLLNFTLQNINLRLGDKAKPLHFQLALQTREELANKLLARALLSLPFNPNDPRSFEKPWTPPTSNGQPRTCLRDSVLGGPDPDAQAEMERAIAAYAMGERFDVTQTLEEAERCADSIEEGATFLMEEAPGVGLTGEDLADVLCGLNVLCNEHLDDRQVPGELVAHLRIIAAGVGPAGPVIGI